MIPNPKLDPKLANVWALETGKIYLLEPTLLNTYNWFLARLESFNRFAPESMKANLSFYGLEASVDMKPGRSYVFRMLSCDSHALFKNLMQQDRGISYNDLELSIAFRVTEVPREDLPLYMHGYMSSEFERIIRGFDA